MSETTITKRTAWVMLFVIAALLAIGVVVGVMLLSRLDAQATQQNHDRIIAACESNYADPYGADRSEMTTCVAELSR